LCRDPAEESLKQFPKFWES